MTQPGHAYAPHTHKGKDKALPPTQALHPLLPVHSSPTWKKYFCFGYAKPLSIPKGTLFHRHTEQGILRISALFVQFLPCIYSQVQSLAVCTHLCPQHTLLVLRHADRQARCLSLSHTHTHTSPTPRRNSRYWEVILPAHRAWWME